MIHYIIVGVLVVIMTFLVRLGLQVVPILPAQASVEAETIDWLFGIHIDLIAFLFSLIMVFIIYSVIVFRPKKGDDTDGEFVSGNTTLEVIWTTVPLGIVLFLAFVGAQALGDIERRDPEALRVDVIASQWSWRFEYPAYGVTGSQLVLPVNQQVLLRMISTDVVHSFWVPEFRVKQDILPGGKEFIRELRITPKEEGDYVARCSELCGEEHYSMLADVIVLSKTEFDAWLVKAQAECDLGAEGCGERWVGKYGCLSCHSTDGSDRVGPTWKGLVGTMISFEDGSSGIADADYVIEAIVDPNMLIREGYNPNVMPQNFSEMLSEQELEDIVSYILSIE